MMRFLVWALGLSPKEGKSGKREAAALIALFTFVLMVWTWGDLDGDQKVSLLSWLLTLSSVLIMAAFGFEALIKQAGLQFGKPPHDQHARLDDPPIDSEDGELNIEDDSQLRDRRFADRGTKTDA